MTTDELIRRLRENPAWGEQGDLMLEAARRLDEQQQTIQQYKKADTFLAAHGWK